MFVCCVCWWPSRVFIVLVVFHMFYTWFPVFAALNRVVCDVLWWICAPIRLLIFVVFVLGLLVVLALLTPLYDSKFPNWIVGSGISWGRRHVGCKTMFFSVGFESCWWCMEFPHRDVLQRRCSWWSARCFWVCLSCDTNQSILVFLWNCMVMVHFGPMICSPNIAFLLVTIVTNMSHLHLW